MNKLISKMSNLTSKLPRPYQDMVDILLFALFHCLLSLIICFFIICPLLLFNVNIEAYRYAIVGFGIFSQVFLIAILAGSDEKQY